MLDKQMKRDFHLIPKTHGELLPNETHSKRSMKFSVELYNVFKLFWVYSNEVKYPIKLQKIPLMFFMSFVGEKRGADIDTNKIMCIIGRQHLNINYKNAFWGDF